ncbi:MAG: 16S rRNA (uracil(1498)-N(3))-methyltransferase [Bacteroidota bacterium]|nr:16S rRNA (uracil(1498)-N(3))-methyltransferase [Bacteroidota bacterium]
MNIFIATVIDKTGTLTSEESWHCAKVLRKKAGDPIQLIDGVGNFYQAVLELVSDKKCNAKILSGPVLQQKRNYYLHLAIAPTKQIDRIEWMIEKAVEIGVDEISFINCHNSERIVIKTERINKIVESAVKQSLQAYLPKVNELVSFKNLIASSNADQKLIAHCFDSEKENIKQIDFKNKSTLVLIGPEGDFSKEEVDLALKNRFKAVSFGTNRLRTETAGLYACQAAALLT